MLSSKIVSPLCVLNCGWDSISDSWAGQPFIHQLVRQIISFNSWHPVPEKICRFKFWHCIQQIFSTFLGLNLVCEMHYHVFTLSPHLTCWPLGSICLPKWQCNWQFPTWQSEVSKREDYGEQEEIHKSLHSAFFRNPWKKVCFQKVPLPYSSSYGANRASRFFLAHTYKIYQKAWTFWLKNFLPWLL